MHVKPLPVGAGVSQNSDGLRAGLPGLHSLQGQKILLCSATHGPAGPPSLPSSPMGIGSSFPVGKAAEA
jgi:hypothetical protein